MRDSSAERAKRFGRIVKDRIDALGLTQVSVAEIGGISVPTLRKVLNGQSVLPAKIQHLDEPLKWEQGSAARTYSGGYPRPLDPAGVGVVWAPGPDEIKLELAELTELLQLLTALTKLNQTIADLTEPELADSGQAELRAGQIDASLEAVSGSLNLLVSRLAGRYATVVLENNGGPGIPLQPMVEMIFGHQLKAPLDADPAVRKEQEYRRFLAHHPVELDPATQEEFIRRWKAATGR